MLSFLPYLPTTQICILAVTVISFLYFEGVFRMAATWTCLYESKRDSREVQKKGVNDGSSPQGDKKE